MEQNNKGKNNRDVGFKNISSGLEDGDKYECSWSKAMKNSNSIGPRATMKISVS
jgi:hypothetical protein